MSLLRVGVDEAGRGPLAGPVVSCALWLPRRPGFRVRDSKKTPPRQRQEIFQWLRQYALFAVALSREGEIDELNILKATFLAFERAISGLLKKAPQLSTAEFVIDGPCFRTSLPVRIRCEKGADARVLEVSCASIVAKVARDHCMELAHCVWPEWDFARHKGYPTARHRELLQRREASLFHRKSYRPCHRRQIGEYAQRADG
ncbi:MAG: ribonuclease HII [Candidatus Omnitrophica bacterium]|nr:ribonuclease HII [Candidatus Omnitrophota bacterium]